MALLLALLLPLVDYYPEHHRSWLREALQKQALADEVVDPREARYILARDQDLKHDLALVGKRYVELAGAPSLAWLGQFPGHEYAVACVSFNRSYYGFLTTQAAVRLKEREWYDETICQTEKLYQLWDAVRDAQTGYYYVTVRRAALLKVLEMVGEEDFCAGRLPPCVPLWRFQQVVGK